MMLTIEIPYLYTAAETEPEFQVSLQSHLLPPDSPKPREILITNKGSPTMLSPPCLCLRHRGPFVSPELSQVL